MDLEVINFFSNVYKFPKICEFSFSLYRINSFFKKIIYYNGKINLIFAKTKILKVYSYRSIRSIRNIRVSKIQFKKNLMV